MRKGAAARCKPCSQVIVITSKCRVWPNPSPATRTPSPCIASKVVLLPSLRPNQTQPSHRTSHSRRPLYDHASALAGPSTLPKRHQQPLSPRFALPRWGKTTFVKRTRLKSRHTGSTGIELDLLVPLLQRPGQVRLVVVDRVGSVCRKRDAGDGIVGAEDFHWLGISCRSRERQKSHVSSGWFFVCHTAEVEPFLPKEEERGEGGGKNWVFYYKKKGHAPMYLACETTML